MTHRLITFEFFMDPVADEILTQAGGVEVLKRCFGSSKPELLALFGEADGLEWRSKL